MEINRATSEEHCNGLQDARTARERVRQLFLINAELILMSTGNTARGQKVAVLYVPAAKKLK